MAVNEYVNRVETVNDEVLMDISEDTVTESDVLKGKTFHLANGAPAVGTRNECDCGDFDILEGNLPISFKGNGNPLYNYEIKGNNNINHVDESQSTLPISIDTYGGNAVDWEIFGNNNPVVETKNGNLPLEITSSAGNVIDYTIYGNNDCNKNLLEITAENQTINGVTFTVDKQAGIITVNGTATANARIEIGTIDIIATEQYNLSGNIETPSESENRISALYVYSHSDLGIDYGDGVNLRSVETDILGAKIAFMVYENKTVENAVIRPMFRLANTTSDFEPYTVGVGERTKNLLEITAESQTIAGVKYTVDKQAGTVTATRVSASTNNSTFPIDIPDELSGQNLYFSGCPSEGSANTCDIYALDYTTTTRAPQWDGTTLSATDYGTSDNNEVRFVEGHRSQIRLRIKADYDAQNIVFKPMLRKADASSVFVPYGYQIPLDIQHKTKNLLDITGYNRTHYSVLWYEDNGQLKASGTYSDSAAHTWPRFYLELSAGTYTLSGSPDYEQSGVQVQIGTCADDQGSNFSLLGYDTGSGYTFTLQTGSWVSIRVYTASRLYQQTIDLTLPLMLHLANTSSNFEPYYLTNHEDIYIGNSPLTQGQSITKAQSGQDITLFSGDNSIDTTLYNKPNVSITYNSNILGVGEPTQNEFEITGNDTYTYRGVTFVRDNINNTIVANGQATGNVFYECGDITLKAGVKYILTGCPAGGSYSPNTYLIYAMGHIDWGYDTGNGLVLPIMTEDTVITPRIGVYTGAGAFTDLVFKPEVKKVGYQIPISVTSRQQSVLHNIYVGENPLTAEQSISKTSTGTDIVLYQGENTISTTLGNKPEMKIDYLSTEVGVGERTKNYINYTDIDATDYGVHCYWENDSVHVEGTFSESTARAPAPFRRFCYLEVGTYILSGSTDYTTTGFHLQVGTCSDDAGSNFTIMGYDNGSGYTFTLQDASYVGVRIYIAAAASGQQIDAVMPIMLRRADTTSDFIPYGYQIPIQIIQRTENLFNKDAPYTASKYLNTSGEEISGSTWGISEYIPIEGNTTYSAYNLSSGGASTCWYDENKDFIGGANYGGATSKSFSLPSNAKYIRITIRLLNPSNIDTLMLIKGSTSPENYIPYYNIIEKDIYIGDSPLIEGQSVTKELLLEDIPTYNGETIIDTTLYNKPYSIIIPTNKAANIIKEIQKLWDAIKSINPSSQSNNIDILKKRIKLSNNVDSPVIIENISDVKVYEEDTQNSTNQESGDLI